MTAIPEQARRRSSAEREAERAERARQRAEEKVIREAQRKLVEEAREKRIEAIRAGARRAEAIAERKAEQRATLRLQREAEEKLQRKAAKKRMQELRERHRIGRDEAQIVREEREWLAANERPLSVLPDEPAFAIPGMLGMAADVRRHVEPMLEQPPAVWTGKWVMKRIADAYLALYRLPGRELPAGFGRAWPAYLDEFADEVGRKSTRADRKTTVIKVATIQDIERMETVFRWPAEYLADVPEARRALFKWASARLSGTDQRQLAAAFGMAPSTFRRFRLRAAGLLAMRLNSAGVRSF